MATYCCDVKTFPASINPLDILRFSRHSHLFVFDDIRERGANRETGARCRNKTIFQNLLEGLSKAVCLSLASEESTHTCESLSRSKLYR